MSVQTAQQQLTAMGRVAEAVTAACLTQKIIPTSLNVLGYSDGIVSHVTVISPPHLTIFNARAVLEDPFLGELMGDVTISKAYGTKPQINVCGTIRFVEIGMDIEVQLIVVLKENSA